MSEYRRSFIKSPRILGLALILVGVVALVGQIFGFNFSRFIWPFFIITPGVIFFIFSLTATSEGEGFAIVGSIMTVLGLLFLYQSTFDHWESWAYAWALIGPTAVGLGQIVYGTLKGKQNTVKSGWDVTKIGLGMFAIGFIFFELILNISGLRFGLMGWSILLIAVGVIVLLRALLTNSETGE